ncbi:hypothetical protein CMO89_02150 [Candidatus Woesearchaeota archaeon]|nr:hypothetical protein [Candidatus Woesearchaeota archaeon]|tara:strand:- start:19128 stop:20186 length:1059 start_codon:yes stop_codon:yes gene_type:complete
MNFSIPQLNLLLENIYIQSLLTFIFFLFLATIIILFYKRYIKKIALKTKTKADDIILEKSEKPVFYILLLVGIKMAIKPLSITNPAVQSGFDTLVIIVIAYIISSFVNTVISLWGKKIADATKSTLDDEILPLFHSFSKVLIWAIALIIIFDTWGVEIGPLLASLGIAGIAIAFALQTSLGNLFGSVSLILDKTFKVGDVIQLESGEIGQIVGVGLRSTKLKTFDNELLIIPNGQLSNSKIKNLAKPNNILRIVLPIGVAYGSDIDKVKETLLNTLKNIDGTVHSNDEKFKPRVRFIKMNDFSLDFELRFYIEDYKERFDISDKILSKAYKELNKQKIDIPFPTRTVYLKKD